MLEGITLDWRVHLQILLWNDSGIQRLRVEIRNSNWIVENHTETFSMVWKQKIYSRNYNLRIMVRGIFSLLNNSQYKPKSASWLYPWFSTLRTSHGNNLTDFLNQPSRVVPVFLRVSVGFDDKGHKVIGLLLLSLPQETNIPQLTNICR